MAEETSNEYTPPALSFTDEASTSRDNIQGASPALGAYPTLSYDAWRYQWNTQHSSLTDETCNAAGVTANASTSSLLLWSSTSIDHGRPSTSRAGTEQATAISEDGARLPETSSVGQWNTQYHMVDGTSSIAGHTDNTEDGSTGFRLPVYSSSSSGGDDAVASTISAGIEEASGVLGNEARCRNATGTGGRELEELGGVCGSVSRGRDAPPECRHEHTGHTARFCKTRDQYSVNQTKFVEHSRNRTAENRRCEICGKLFHRARDLVRHYRTHTHERPHKCEICDKSFSHPSTLRNHQLTHTDERAHVCLICTTAFKTKASLKRHLNLNCRYGAFVCDICNLSFLDNLGLSRHRQSMHGNKTPYDHTHCAFSFAETETVDEHLCQSNTCYLCGNSYEDDVQLITHLATHRAEQP